MSRRRLLTAVVVVVIAGIIIGVSLRGQNPAPSIDIMAGSSLIANIVNDLADGRLEARAIIPPDVCPGHYDVKLDDIEALAKAKALIIHNYQQNYQNILGATQAAQNPNLVIAVVNVTGNWMVPAVQAEGVAKVAQALCEIYPENADYYREKATQTVQAILAKGEEVRARLLEAEVGAVKVLCAAMQEGFVEWAGFDVVATFGRPEELTPGQMAALIDQCKGAGVALVIDNFQSGTTTLGASLGQDIEAIPVTISNFPGGLPDTETWEKAVYKNVDLLLAALNEWKERYG